ncbi:uncharacterized protein [Panulirus ornatus]|uniref:uncharacterized protein isoform X2 n=1 Tax=Panulirus ornatus TaxID=150431 RepID=UPI003A84B5B6
MLKHVPKERSSKGTKPPRKYVRVTIKTKLEVLEKLARKIPVKDIIEDYGIGKSTVYNILAAKDNLQAYSQAAQPDASEAQDVAVTKSSIRKHDFEAVDKAVYDWYVQQRAQDVLVSGVEIQSAASRFAAVMDVEGFQASQEWLINFQRQYISNRRNEDESGTMTTMARVAHEVREMYLSKFKKMSPYTCNAMSPRVLLLRLSPKVIEKYTSQHKGKSDQYFSDEEEDWALSATDDWANDDQDWNMTLLEPIVQISDESSSREVSSRNHGGIVSPKKKGRHLPLVPGIDRRKSPIDDIPIKQESPEPMEEISPDVSEGILPSSSPYAPTLPMFQVPSAILPVYMAQPPSAHPSPSFSQSQSSPGLPNPSFSQHPSAPVHPSHSFPLSNNEDLYTGSNHQTSSTRTQKSPEQAGKETYFDKDNIEANIKQEMPDEVIVMPFESDLHSDEPMAMPVEVVCASPLPAVGDFSTSEDSSVQEYPNGKSSEVFDDHLVSTCHRSLKELTRLLLELNNKNLMCDEKIQKLKEEYDKKVAVIETEKKANEKEIDRVLSLIQNWKEGPKGDASLST